MIPAPLARHGPWFSAAPASVAVPHHVPSSTSRSRFNDGSGAFAVRYLAPSPVIALIEAAVVSGDSDLLPAFEAAQREGVVVCLVHGPRSTYASDLRSLADERIDMDGEFMDALRQEVGGRT